MKNVNTSDKYLFYQYFLLASQKVVLAIIVF